MTKMQLLRFFIFFMIIIFVFIGLNDFFSMKTNYDVERIRWFNKQPRNSLDVVLVGASGIYRFWSTMDAWHDYGIVSSPWSTSGMPFPATKYVIEEVLKDQSPDLLVIDYRNLRNKDNLKPGFIRKVTDNMPLSVNRFNAINALLDFAHIDSDHSEYYFSFLLYHSRWEQGLTSDDFGFKMNEYCGTTVDNKVYFKITPLKETKPTVDRLPLDSDMERSLIDLLEYCKQNDLTVLFVASPFEISQKERKILNSAQELIASYGFSYINFNDIYNQLDLDFSKDFYDSGHTNYYGMKKFTDYLSEHIKQNYQIPDRRGIEDYRSWNESYFRFSDKIEELKSNSEENG